MEPRQDARRWIGELLGAGVDGDLSRAAEAWATLGPDLAAILQAAVPAETQPALMLRIPSQKPQA